MLTFVLSAADRIIHTFMGWFGTHKPCMFALLAGILHSTAAAAPTDSLAYILVREKVLANDFLPEEYDGYLAAAESLASDGFYEEAYAILTDIAEEDTFNEKSAPLDGAGNKAAAIMPLEETEHLSGSGKVFSTRRTHEPDDGFAQSKRSVTWRITGGASYDRFAYGIDPEDSTGDTLLDDTDSLFALDYEEQPLTGRLQASARIENLNSVIAKMEPSVYLSTTRLRGSFDLAGDIVENAFSYSLSTTAHKKRAQSYGDSSDALNGELKLSGSTARWSEKAWVTIPIMLSGEQYRYDRPTYARFAEMRLHPAFNLNPGTGGTHLQLQWRHEQIWFSKEYEDRNSVCAGPQLNLDFWKDHFSAMLSLGLTRHRFPFDDAPTRRDELLITTDMRITAARWIEPALEANISREREWYSEQLLGYEIKAFVPTSVWDTTTQSFATQIDTVASFGDTLVSYQLDGTTIRLRPSLRITPWSSWYLQPELGFEWYNYPVMTTVGEHILSYSPSLWESRVAWEPMMRLGFTGDRLQWEVRGGFRIEDIVEAEFTSDSREIILGGDASWQVLPWARIDCVGGMRYRMLDEYSNETDTYLSLTSSFVF
ncbi:MAG: hypothetical protein GF344_07570 [Chitinivibrionales bacterium]|nr:hypothetical protein [Chitinivibrionales bacterium]MBD3356757.1 hypothetical protein [Chitinivibrionales bacterium]